MVKTDKYTPSWVGGVAGGSFELPPGTYAMEVVITAASTPGVTYGVIVSEQYADGSNALMAYNVYLSPSAPYATVWHTFSRPDAKVVGISILPPIGSGTYIVDAFITVYGDAKAYWQRFHVVHQRFSGVISASRLIRSNGVYLALLGFTAPPGAAYATTYLVGSVTICGPVGDHVNVYWGTAYLGRVYRTSVSGSCKTFNFNLYAPPYENVKTGGSTHFILVGPVGTTASVAVNYLGLHGLYRPEMNRETSQVWRDVLPWGYAVYTGLTGRAEMKIYDLGSDDKTGSMRVAIYLSPYQNQALCINTLRVRLALNNGNDMLAGDAYGLYVEGNESLDVVSLILSWVVQLLETMSKILEKVGKVVSWILLGKDTVKVLGGWSTISVVSVNNYLDIYVSLVPTDADKPAIARVAIADTYQGSGYTVSVKEVYMCGVLAHSDASTAIPAMQYYKPWSYVVSTATQFVDIYRTFTCGKQEVLTRIYERGWLGGRLCWREYYR